MALIEEVSALSEKFYSIDATNYEEDVEKSLLGLGFTREDFQRQMCIRDRYPPTTPAFSHPSFPKEGNGDTTDWLNCH